VRRFNEQHSHVTLTTAIPLSLARVNAIDVESFSCYFKNGIHNNSSRIFNYDETVLPLAPKGLKVVAKAGSKKC